MFGKESGHEGEASEGESRERISLRPVRRHYGDSVNQAKSLSQESSPWGPRPLTCNLQNSEK